jgi:hypothetical protein
LGRVSGLEGIGDTGAPADDTTAPAGEIDTVEIQPNNAGDTHQGGHAPADWGQSAHQDTDAGMGQGMGHGMGHGAGQGAGQGYRGYNHGGPQFHRPNRPYHYPSNGTHHDGNRWHGQGYGGNRGYWHHNTTTSPPPSVPTNPPPVVAPSYGNMGSEVSPVASTQDPATQDTAPVQEPGTGGA